MRKDIIRRMIEAPAVFAGAVVLMTFGYWLLDHYWEMWRNGPFLILFVTPIAIGAIMAGMAYTRAEPIMAAVWEHLRNSRVARKKTRVENSHEMLKYNTAISRVIAEMRRTRNNMVKANMTVQLHDMRGKDEDRARYMLALETMSAEFIAYHGYREIAADMVRAISIPMAYCDKDATEHHGHVMDQLDSEIKAGNATLVAAVRTFANIALGEMRVK